MKTTMVCMCMYVYEKDCFQMSSFVTLNIFFLKESIGFVENFRDMVIPFGVLCF